MTDGRSGEVGPEPWQEAGFGLYLHWPFCQSKCPYCDFNSHVASTIDQSRWKRAYLTEIARLAAEVPGRTLSTVFLGGGTPSLMEPEVVGAVLDAARAAWPCANDLEVTLEANPGSVEAGRFRGYRDAGVNRVSLGVQSLDDTALRALGRLHTAADARRAVEIAQATFPRVSFDMIYARQHQTTEAWRSELREALSMAGEHLSLYQLTVEDGTTFAERHARGGLAGLPGEDLSVDLFELTQELTEDAGFGAYEVSNHARADAECRHNLIYWRSGDWVGLGPGAHGRLTLQGQRVATTALRAPQAWLQRVEASGDGDESRHVLSEEDRRAEFLLMGLRLSEGIDLERFGDVPDTGHLESLGLVERDATRLRATRAGRLVLNSVIAALSPP